MERDKIIKEMLAKSTGRPPTGLIKIADHLMSLPQGVLVQEVSGNLGLGTSTVNDAFRRLVDLGYLDKERKNREKYKKERLVATGKEDVHRMPYVYKLNKRFYDDFEACRKKIEERAEKEFEDSQILDNTLKNGLRAHIALNWEGIWETNFGRLEIEGGYPTSGRYPNGTILGQSIGDTLKGTWQEGKKSGRFEFRMASDRKSFSGKRLSNINQRLCDWNGSLLLNK